MLGRATGAVLVGVQGHLVDVEVDLAGGLPTIAAVGLPDASVREGIDRIRAALRHAGFRLPQHRVTVNLAPAEVRKQGASLDLPMAAALLQADGQFPPERTGGAVLVGELALDGALRPIRGALAIALAARQAGRRMLLLPAHNAEEAALVEDLEVVPLRSLEEVVALCRGLMKVEPKTTRAQAILRETSEASSKGVLDLEDVRGQAGGRRALEVAAAGGHHLLLSGPPGSGKSMLARRLPGILPPLDLGEALEVTRVWGAAGVASGLVASRPFRAPHHGISLAGLVGGGAQLRPGEVSLATHGVLYLDELTEFRRDALEALRQPIEDGLVTVVRVRACATFPARFQLVASMNPCACGWHGDPRGRCRCTPQEVRRYWMKLSAPLIDRFDIVVEVPPVELVALSSAARGEPSSSVRARVVSARERQRERFGENGPTCNARMSPSDLDRYAPLSPTARRVLLDACERMGLSARGFDRVRRVARTLADLELADVIAADHVAEAVQYRWLKEIGGVG